MAFFEDLSVYEYFHARYFRPGTKNVGWLGLGHEFNTAEPDEELLNVLWNVCKVSVVQTRGLHDCEFCPFGTSRHAERNGEGLLLGSSEIRVFSREGMIYAAPTLIYHYVKSHKYRPPAEFLKALAEGPLPPSREYFQRLEELELKWNKTSDASGEAFRFECDQPNSKG